MDEKLKDAALVLVGLREPLEHLVLADSKPVLLLEPALERRHRAGVAVHQVVPDVHVHDAHPAAHFTRT